MLKCKAETKPSRGGMSRTTFAPSELDILSRAFYQALDRVQPEMREIEVAKTVLMTGILDAARDGERDEDRLVSLALGKMMAHDEYLPAQMRAR